MERNVLGKGLSALIPEGALSKERIQSIPLDQIRPSSFQPRKKFAEEALKDLAESIREKGVIQPILVRQTDSGFELIAGERRYRAVKLLGLGEIPAIIKKVADGDLLEIALIENIQREELNKIEEARAYERLTSEFGLTHETISKRVGKDRATISNMLRLLELPEKIQKFLEESTITMGHARGLLGLGDQKRQMKLCEEIVKKGLSVRQVENAVRQDVGSKKIFRARPSKNPEIRHYEETLQHRLGTRVRIVQGKKRGKVVIDFYSAEDLNRVLTLLIPPE